MNKIWLKLGPSLQNLLNIFNLFKPRGAIWYHRILLLFVKWRGITWPNTDALSPGTSGTILSEIFIKLKNFSLDKMNLKKSSAKCQLFCASFEVLKCVLLIVFWWLCAIRQYYSSLALSYRFMNVGNILNFLKWEKVNHWTHWTQSHIKLDCFDYNIKWGATHCWKMQHDEIPISYMQPTVCVFHTLVSVGSIWTNHYL